MTETNFSAKEPSLGYYYQLRLGLYLILKAKDKENPIIKIESLDDIQIEDINSMDLYQTKLHINSVVNLTDSSSDFWKTIRVWSENILNNMLKVDETVFILMTTAKIGEGSFIENLKLENRIRDTDSIQREMFKIASSSGNVANSKAYAAFKSLSNEVQNKLIQNITVIDNSLSIDDALKYVKGELKFATHPNRLNSLVERLEGWWFQKCISLLQNQIEYISSKEIQVKISDINDSLKEDNLPDDFANPMDIDEGELKIYHDKLFVAQLKLIAVKSNTLRSAINDFHKAFKQRSKWLREELTSIDDEELFEKRLEDHWANIFSLMKDHCEGIDKELLWKYGYDFYKNFYVERVPPIKIRERFTSEYLTRGSCHILSDKKRIGWHPNFNALLNE